MKSKVMISSLLAAVLVCGALPAHRTATAVPAESVSMYEKVSGFETVDDLFTLRFGNRFGEVRVNKNKEFVSEGDASAKLEVWGYFNANGANPVMMVPLLSESQKNLKRLKAVEFDLFNQSGRDAEIKVALKVDGFTTEYQSFSVKQGKNKVSATFDTVGIALAADLTKGEGVLIELPQAESFETPDANVFYIDNMGLTMTLKEPTPLTIDLDENEFCSFDKDYQKYMTIVSGVGPTIGSQPTLSINEDLNYVSGGTGKSLKVVMPTGLPPLNDGWPYFSFIDALFEKVDFARYAREGYSLKFDVYNTGAAFNFGLEAHAKKGDTIKAKGYSVAVTCVKGWNEFSFKLADWDNVSEEYPQKLTENFNDFWFSYGKFSTSEKVFYFDNFRFEKD
ncbi:MAG: hypothetical protein DBX59_05125 [Bacillota bacterium]|nr:MAG: hypothetical protein DBX59_05125 [Bacillota bacterium]